MEELKKCTKCLEEKPANTEFFHRDTSNRRCGLRAHCKECQRKYVPNPPEKRKPKRPTREGFKYCPACERELEATTDIFPRNKGAKDGLNLYCKSCQNEKHRIRYQASSDMRDKKNEYQKQRVLNGKQKAASGRFYQRHKEEIAERGRENKQIETKKFIEYQKEFYPEFSDESLLRKCKQRVNYYGITWEQFFDTRRKQNGKCAICSKPETEFSGMGKHKMLYIDHCHVTNEIRGLICPSCNLLLGASKDSAEILRSAIAYLENPPGIVKNENPIQV